MEEVRAIFAVLSRPDGEQRHDGLITLGKLQAACSEFEARRPLPPKRTSLPRSRDERDKAY